MAPLTIFGENGEGVAHSDISIFPASEFPPPFPREVAFRDIAHRNVQNRHETANFREKEARGRPTEDTRVGAPFPLLADLRIDTRDFSHQTRGANSMCKKCDEKEKIKSRGEK